MFFFLSDWTDGAAIIIICLGVSDADDDGSGVGVGGGYLPFRCDLDRAV